jgi:hypothetical protein
MERSVDRKILLRVILKVRQLMSAEPDTNYPYDIRRNSEGLFRG